MSSSPIEITITPVVNARTGQRWVAVSSRPAPPPHRVPTRGRARRANDGKGALVGRMLQHHARHDPCPYCGRNGEPMSVDHIIPLARGGSNGDDNLVVCCASCNERKRDQATLAFLLSAAPARS